MKKISIFYFLAALFLVGCSEEDKPNLGIGEQWLQFGQQEYSIAENTPEPLVVTVLLGAQNNPNDITVGYTVTSDTPGRFELGSTTGSVVIAAGEFSADIVIMPVDNFQADGDATLTLALQDHPDYPLGIAGEGLFAQTAEIEIVDNDCPVDLEAMVGTYEITEMFSAGGTNAGITLADNFGESYQIEVSLAPGDQTGTKLLLSNSEGYHTYFDPNTVITLRTCSGTFSFDNGNPRLALWQVLAVATTSYDDQTQQISVTGPLGNYGPYQFLLSKIQD